jgi:hypothetical protein
VKVTCVPHGSLRWATPTVVGVSVVPQAVCFPQNPGPYQVAALYTVQLPGVGVVLGAAAGSGVVPPGVPPVCALAGAATISIAIDASPAIARIVRLLVKPSSFVAYGVS